jgi:hypothetical protein
MVYTALLIISNVQSNEQESDCVSCALRVLLERRHHSNVCVHCCALLQCDLILFRAHVAYSSVHFIHYSCDYAATTEHRCAV